MEANTWNQSLAGAVHETIASLRTLIDPRVSDDEWSALVAPVVEQELMRLFALERARETGAEPGDELLVPWGGNHPYWLNLGMRLSE